MPNNCVGLSIFETIKCEIFKNDLQVFSKFEDQFNFAEWPDGQIVIYSSNRIINLASCMSVKEISIFRKCKFMYKGYTCGNLRSYRLSN